MQAKEIDKNIYDVDGLLDQQFGKVGTAQRAAAEEKAFSFYTGAVIEEARKKAKINKAELARRIGSDRSYITRIEQGLIEPKVSTFYRIVTALGFTVGLTPMATK
jgi:ribosome-binding protein aMBF1 (putative translation factor)